MDNPTGAPPPPLDSVPLPPRGYRPRPLGDYRGYRPTRNEVRLAKVAEQSLRAFTDSAERLGRNAPDPLFAANYLAKAVVWRQLRDAAAAFAVYTRERDAVAWCDALKATEEFKRFFLPMVAFDVNLKDTYPALIEFLAVGKETGKLVSKTKKKKAKAKLKADAKASAGKPART